MVIDEKAARQRSAQDALRDLGYRLTPQRAMVLAAIEDSDNHVTAEQVHALVSAKYPQVNISTVYRTLDLLKELGLVTETDMGGGRLSYHPAQRGRHHHLVCQKCGAITEMEESLLAPLKRTLDQQYGFKADLRHLAIFGRCRKCGE